MKPCPGEHKLGLLLAWQEEVGQHNRERLQSTCDNPEELPPYAGCARVGRGTEDDFTWATQAFGGGEWRGGDQIEVAVDLNGAAGVVGFETHAREEGKEEGHA